MSINQRCEARREKLSRYMSRANPSGRSYQKCGRKAVIVDPATDKPYCKQCAEQWSIRREHEHHFLFHAGPRRCRFLFCGVHVMTPLTPEELAADRAFVQKYGLRTHDEFSERLPLTPLQRFRDGYIAARAESAKEIAELKAQVASLTVTIRAML